MRTPAIAHFGATLMEAPPPAGVAQRDAAIDGELARTLEFLTLLGFEPHLENFYPGIGRQYIWRRGDPADVDYVEQDNFTSYTAVPRPATNGPRVGDCVFRLTHAAPREVLRKLEARELVTVDDQRAREAFLAGDEAWLLVQAPNRQTYELGTTQARAEDNHVVYVWTARERLDEIAAGFGTHFGLQQGTVTGFHGQGRVLYLTRTQPGVTVGLLHDPAAGLNPRFSEDIFAEAGYPHFRLAAPDKPRTERAVREAFPPGGDVAFVYFEDCYLELVQA